MRGAYFLVRMVLAQAVVDNALPSSPADYVKLPTKASAAVDNPTQFLTAAQVTALVAATPWPYNVYVHVAAWAGLRAAELAGLQVGDVELPPPSLNPNAPAKPGALRVERSARPLDGVVTYLAPKTQGSRRRVPLTAATTELLRDYLAVHPRADEPSAPLFPGMAWLGPRKRNADQPNVDWANPLRHSNFYQSVYRPAVVRAGLPPGLKFHALRHTYASLCVAAGIPPLALSRFMGHTSVTITLGVYAHLFADDHADAMAALGAYGRAEGQDGQRYTAAGSRFAVQPRRAAAQILDNVSARDASHSKTHDWFECRKTACAIDDSGPGNRLRVA